jgi:hypothetical protein
MQIFIALPYSRQFSTSFIAHGGRYIASEGLTI